MWVSSEKIFCRHDSPDGPNCESTNSASETSPCSLPSLLDGMNTFVPLECTCEYFCKAIEICAGNIKWAARVGEPQMGFQVFPASFSVAARSSSDAAALSWIIMLFSRWSTETSIRIFPFSPGSSAIHEASWASEIWRNAHRRNWIWSWWSGSDVSKLQLP